MPTDKLLLDVDSDRSVGVDLQNLFIIGTNPGDTLVVAYLQEEEK